KKLARSLALRFREIRVETNKGAKLIEIGRIFIPSKLVHWNMSKPLQQILGNESKKGAKGEARLVESDTGELAAMSYGEFQDSFRRVVVLGDPGGGKSTLSQYLCYQLAKTSAA